MKIYTKLSDNYQPRRDCNLATKLRLQVALDTAPHGLTYDQCAHACRGHYNPGWKGYHDEHTFLNYVIAHGHLI